MESDVIRAAIRERMRQGQLPSTPPLRTWGGRSDGTRCAGCTRAIRKGTPEIECEVPAASHLYFHPVCFNVWRDLASRPT